LAAKKDEVRLSSIRVLLVDDYEDWRNQVRLLLQERPEWQVICEVSGGLEAVQKAEELKPDLIVMDVGLPKLNGIEAACSLCQTMNCTSLKKAELLLRDN
jgi:DNA-binding NarL/FixJ family response regulator